tara:strand:+ start:826 stop:1530 length:705 start_codon:yes stop_codon:yes gene_type:complete
MSVLAAGAQAVSNTNPWLKALSIAAPIGLQWWQGRKANQQMDEAMEGQERIADSQMQLQQQYADIDVPYKASLYDAMGSRGERKMPRFLQRSFTATNPYANVKRVAPSLSMLQSTPKKGGGGMEAFFKAVEAGADPQQAIEAFQSAGRDFKNPLIANALKSQLQGAKGGFLKRSQAPKAMANPIVGRGRYGAMMRNPNAEAIAGTMAPSALGPAMQQQKPSGNSQQVRDPRRAG